ncbi:MAG: hypothetical protein AB1523_14480 [Bacillota bacterium]
MNAFESIVAQYLEEEGYWVRKSVKINISKEDKQRINLPTMPRPEIDLVALNVKENELLLIEAKSFLDSPGVRFNDVSGGNPKGVRRYRLFTEKEYRDIVTQNLREDYFKKGLINESTKINYALAAGKIYSNDEQKIKNYFSQNRWKLFTPGEIKNKIKELSKKGWEDNLVTMTAKLILKS